METCRTCARCDFEDENKWFDLFHTTRWRREIEEMRVEFYNWQLQITPNDGLPQKICSDCFSKFCNIFSFRLQCQQAQVRLKNIFDKIETNSGIDDETYEDDLEELNEQLLRIIDENSRQTATTTNSMTINEDNCHKDNFTATDADAVGDAVADADVDGILTTHATPSSPASDIIVMMDMLNEPDRANNNYITTNSSIAADIVGEGRTDAKQQNKFSSVVPTTVSTKTIVNAVLINSKLPTINGNVKCSIANANTEAHNYTAVVSVECQSETEMQCMTTKLQRPTTNGDKGAADEEIAEEQQQEALDEERVELNVVGHKVTNADADADADRYAGNEIEKDTDNGGENKEMEEEDMNVDDIIEEDFEVDVLADDGTGSQACEFNGSLTQSEGYDVVVENVHLMQAADDEFDGDSLKRDADADAGADEIDYYYDEVVDDADGNDSVNEAVLEAFEPVTLSTNTNNNTIILSTTLASASSLSSHYYTSSTTATCSTTAINYNLITSAPTSCEPPKEISIVFECKYCHKTKDTPSANFETQHALLEHITNAHDTEYPFTCPQRDCKEGFRDAASRTVHMKSAHVAKHYECDVCGKKYADRVNLRHHHEKFHSEMDFGCETCEKRFYSRKSLNYHMKWHNPELLLKCSHCDRLFINQRHLRCHEDTHNGLRNSECCTFCGKTFIHLKTLRWHLYRQHGGEKPYKCGHCTEVFASYLEKRIHMLENHLENLTTIERTECMLCRQHYNNEHDLSEHIRSKHVNRPKSSVLLIANNKRVVRSKRQKHYSGIFQCDICGQRFNMKSALERHAAVHSSVGRPHKCPVETCAKRFKRAQDMNWHMKTHSNEKPNVCDVCGKGFALKYVLNQHKRSHEVLEKNFKCLICGRAYLFEKSLRVHERVHTGETYYRCDLCGENFVTHMKFKTHMMKKHDPNTTNIDDYNLDILDEHTREL